MHHDKVQDRPQTSVSDTDAASNATGEKSHRFKVARHRKQAAKAEETAVAANEKGGQDQAAFPKMGRDQKFNAHIDLGRFQENQDHLELALAEYQSALQECESRAPHLAGSRQRTLERSLAHRRIAAVLDRLGKFEQSETHYRTALKLSPNDSRVWNDAGYSYYLQGRWVDSERCSRQPTSSIRTTAVS